MPLVSYLPQPEGLLVYLLEMFIKAQLIDKLFIDIYSMSYIQT